MTFRYIFAFVLLTGSIFPQDTLNTVSISAVGDIMLGTDFPRDRLPENEGRDLLQDVLNFLSEPDLTIGNYEGVLIDGGIPKKKCKDTTKCYLFRTPTRYVKNLKEAGFDILSIANNHANDFGEEGIRSTQKTLDEAGIKYSGPFGKIAYREVKDLKIAFIAFATSPGMYSMLNIREARRLVEELEAENDIVIVSFHGGAEGIGAMHVTDSLEIAYGEKRGNVIKFSHAVIDAGADLVIGHGPHVPRALELYKNKLIAYSLGNFCTYKGFSLIGPKGFAPILQVELNKQGDFITGKIVSAIQQRPYGPLLDSSSSVFKLIRNLTITDFPQSGLNFSENGYFSPVPYEGI